jgi:hypothetical protein
MNAIKACSILTAMWALAGCAPSELADPAPQYAAALAAPAQAAGAAPADLTLWAADGALENWTRDAVAPRVLAATGLTVAVVPRPAGAIPLFWMNRNDAEAEGWWGLTHMADGDGDEHPAYLAIGEAVPGYMIETVLLHEALHALGAHHVGQGLGVMSPQAAEQFAITEADLQSLCAVADCSVFQPEK